MALFSSHLHIHHNNISNNSIAGIHLYNSGNITFAYNNFSHCTKGILFDYSGNSTLNNNIFFHCKFGIILGVSLYNTLTYNTFSNNTYGLFLSTSWNTLLSYNIFSHNRDYGLILGFISWNNIIKDNDFLGNNLGGRSQAYDNGTNNVFAHNYWDDHDTTDQNSDGIADTPYPIDGEAVNQDLYPLMARANPTATLPPLDSFPPSRGTVSLLFATLFLAMSSMRGFKRKKMVSTS
ncbi:MAG: nitrous oxide reductase family maturation protein NosD [Candidatus Hodarchaeota archaeon]